jgi:DNA-3-methyladenine glycosylase
MVKLQKEFYLQKCPVVAKELIGKILVRKKEGKVYSGIIVETEAYLGEKDPASHAYPGKTKRNENMFKEGGIVYVYFTYGNHFCFNVVTGPEGTAHAVLIRAVDPLLGIDDMKRNRGTEDIYNLASGPGKLAKAFEIDSSLNGASLLGSEIYILDSQHKGYKVLKSKRIGITKNPDKLLRFYAKDNMFVSQINKKTDIK